MIKSLATPMGNELTYWKITGVSVAYVTELAIINLGGYIDEEAKVAKADCIPKNFRVVGDDFRKYFNNVDIACKDLREIGYTYIKENSEEFKDAINC
jgi:hypothetical protein